MKQVNLIVDYIRSKTDIVPEYAIIVSMGFKDIIDKIDDKVVVKLADIKGITVLGKDVKNRYVIGKLGGKPIIALVGRMHSYLGYNANDYSAPWFALKELGCKVLIPCTALGAINFRYKVGDIFLAEDYINNTGESPLNGLEDKYGSRYFDLSHPYKKEYNQKALKIAKSLGLRIREGVLIEFCGPNGESPAEIKMARLFGADAVGSNIIKETILAKYCGLKVLSVNLITNYASGVSHSRIKYEDIHYNMDVSSDYFCDYLQEIIKVL